MRPYGITGLVWHKDLWNKDSWRGGTEKGQQNVFNYQPSVLALKTSNSFPRDIPQPPSSSDPTSQTQPGPRHSWQLTESSLGSSLGAQELSDTVPTPSPTPEKSPVPQKPPDPTPVPRLLPLMPVVTPVWERTEASLGLSVLMAQNMAQLLTVIQLLGATGSRTDGWGCRRVLRTATLQPGVLGKTELHLPKLTPESGQWLVGEGLLQCQMATQWCH